MLFMGTTATTSSQSDILSRPAVSPVAATRRGVCQQMTSAGLPCQRKTVQGSTIPYILLEEGSWVVVTQGFGL